MANEKLVGDRCTSCNGTGNTIAQVEKMHMQVDCPDCVGTGIINSSNACSKCQGSGDMIVGIFQTNCDHCNGAGLEPI